MNMRVSDAQRWNILSFNNSIPYIIIITLKYKVIGINIAYLKKRFIKTIL